MARTHLAANESLTLNIVGVHSLFQSDSINSKSDAGNVIIVFPFRALFISPSLPYVKQNLQEKILTQFGTVRGLALRKAICMKLKTTPVSVKRERYERQHDAGRYNPGQVALFCNQRLHLRAIVPTGARLKIVWQTHASTSTAHLTGLHGNARSNQHPKPHKAI